MFTLVKYLCWVCVLALVCGCTTQSTAVLPQPSLLPAPQSPPFNLPVNVYSSYISDATAQYCTQQANDQTACKNDGIAANQFLTTLEKLKLFDELSPSVSRHDYELLIANQLTTATHSGLNERADFRSFTEFTIEWRGVHLDSFLVEYPHQQHVTQQDIEQILLQWSAHARQQNVFSTAYLYVAMGASDYTHGLSLPAQLEDFQLAQQYLYPDPFQGVLARYLHPAFSDAILDVAIYPILANLATDSEALLATELDKAIVQAQNIAASRNMDLSMSQYQQDFASGLMAELSAEGETGEALYATIYVFRLEDKFVKFSSTFPSRISNSLVKQAMSHIQVPAESALMKELRQAL